MASFWIRVNARLADDADVRKFARELLPTLPTWQSVPLACGLLVTLWGRIADEQEDGDLTARDDDALEEWAKWRGEPGAFAGAFRAAFTVDGIVRDWAEYQGPLIDRRRKDRERIRALREAERLRLEAGRGDSPADARADGRTDVTPTAPPTNGNVGTTSPDVGKMSSRNGNENVLHSLTDLPATTHAGGVRHRSQAEGILRRMLEPQEWSDVAAFLLKRPADSWDRWLARMLGMIGPATGALAPDLATACSDALLVTPPVDSPLALSAFVEKRKNLRQYPPEERPPMNGRSRRGPIAPAPKGYDTSANAAAMRRLDREVTRDDT